MRLSPLGADSYETDARVLDQPLHELPVDGSTYGQTPPTFYSNEPLPPPDIRDNVNQPGYGQSYAESVTESYAEAPVSERPDTKVAGDTYDEGSEYGDGGMSLAEQVDKNVTDPYNATHEYTSTPWDVCALQRSQYAQSFVHSLSQMGQGDGHGNCVVHECNPMTNEVHEMPVQCGCHPGQKPPDHKIPTPQLPLPECYINNDGYVCCSRELEQLLVETWNEFKSSRCGHMSSENIQTLATSVQKKLENQFPNRTFESLVGNSDFAVKAQFSGNHMCKIRRDCKIITAFASPNQPDSHDGDGDGNGMGRGGNNDNINRPTNAPFFVNHNLPLTITTPSFNFQGLPQPQAVQPQQPPYYPIPYNNPLNRAFLCFSGDGQVWTAQKRYKRLAELEIGDYVLSSNLNFTKVTGWLHKIPNMYAEFLKIYLENGRMVKMTAKHLIYQAQCSTNKSSSEVNRRLVFAEDLRIGDCLFTIGFWKDHVDVQRILRIQLVVEQGVYAPETASGDIVVNDVIASCYTDINKHIIVSLFKKINYYMNSLIGVITRDAVQSEFIDLPITFKMVVAIIEELIPMKFFYDYILI